MLCWLQGQTALKAMSAAEMAEYEEKKLKMRKAMGENLHDDVQGNNLLCPCFRLPDHTIHYNHSDRATPAQSWASCQLCT